MEVLADPAALVEVERIQAVTARLGAAKAAVDVQDVPLAEVARLLSVQIEIPIRFHERALEDVGLSLETPILFQLSEVAAPTLLRLLLRQLDLTYEIEAQGLVITTPEEAENNVQARYYHAEELLPEPYPDYDSLSFLISTIIEPESWEEGTGPSSIMGYHNGMILRQSQGVHEKIAAFIATLKQAKDLPSQGYPTQALIASPAGHPSDTIYKRFADTKVTLAARQKPLSEVVKQLEKTTSTPFLIDTRALEDIGESPDAFIDLSLEDVSVTQALEIMSEQYELSWITVGEVVVITTPDEAEQDLEVRVYPVRDLMFHGLNPANQDVRKLSGAIAKYFPKYFGGGFGHGDWDLQWSAVDFPELPSQPDYLIDTITTNVEPDSWEGLGGPGGINYFQAADCLVVSQTHRVHSQIAALLQTIRNHQKPLELSDLTEKVRQADATTLIMFYTVPRNREGVPKFTQAELETIAARIQELFGKGIWDDKTHFIDVTQSVVIVRQRRDIQRQIHHFWSNLGPDEGKQMPWQNNSTGSKPTQEGFGGGGQNNTGNAPTTPQPGGVF